MVVVLGVMVVLGMVGALRVGEEAVALDLTMSISE
jgi:hypothetical protein